MESNKRKNLGVIGSTDGVDNILSKNVKFNKKTFNNKVFLSFEMATYWDLSLSKMDEGFYREVCKDERFIRDLEELRASKQFDIALFKLLHYLNPKITNTLKNIVDEDMKNSANETLVKGKLRYRGGEIIPASVYSPEANNIGKLPVEGDEVYTNTKESIILGKKLGDGGEGIVYLSSRNKEVVKLIKPDTNGKIRTYTKNKIEQMIKVKITNPLIVWPTSTIYNDKGDFIGFTMKLVEGMDLKNYTSSIVKNVNDTSNDININSIDKITLCKIILNILDTVIYLHEKNIIIGDIKLENFMIQGDDVTSIYFIDCDSYQLGNYPSLLVSPGFIPPEIDSINLGKQSCRFRTFGNENFAIFSLLFHLVFRAKPPYSQQIHDESYASEVARVRNGMFPYFMDKEKTIHHCPKGMEEQIWSHLPSYIKQAFINCGHIDGDNFGEENRLTPKQWKRLFTSYLNDLEGPKLKLLDPLYNQYTFTKDESIEYDIVDLKLEEQVITTKGLSMEETITNRFRNNHYISTMIKYKSINVVDFDFVSFNNKLYETGVILSHELVENWKLALDYLKSNDLKQFNLSNEDLNQINLYKSSNQFQLALFTFIKVLNPEIFLAYDGFIFESLDEYAAYLNEYYHFVDKSIIPYEILNEVVKDKEVRDSLFSIYSQRSVTNKEVDLIINLLSEKKIYVDNVCYDTLESYICSVFSDELIIKDDNLFKNETLSKLILDKHGINHTKYNFKTKRSFYQLAFDTLGYLPFTFKKLSFKTFDDILEYSRSNVSLVEKFKNIGNWVNSGCLDLFLSYYNDKSQEKVFELADEYDLTDWSAGNLFNIHNNENAPFYFMDGHKIVNLKDLMEQLLKINDIERFMNKINKDCVFEQWCLQFKKED